MYLAYCLSGPDERTGAAPELRSEFADDAIPRAFVPLAELYPDVFARRATEGRVDHLARLIRALRRPFETR